MNTNYCKTCQSGKWHELQVRCNDGETHAIQRVANPRDLQVGERVTAGVEKGSDIFKLGTVVAVYKDENAVLVSIDGEGEGVFAGGILRVIE